MILSEAAVIEKGGDGEEERAFKLRQKRQRGGYRVGSALADTHLFRPGDDWLWFSLSCTAEIEWATLEDIKNSSSGFGGHNCRWNYKYNTKACWCSASTYYAARASTG